MVLRFSCRGQSYKFHVSSPFSLIAQQPLGKVCSNSDLTSPDFVCVYWLVSHTHLFSLSFTPFPISPSFPPIPNSSLSLPQSEDTDMVLQSGLEFISDAAREYTRKDTSSPPLKPTQKLNKIHKRNQSLVCACMVLHIST